MKLANIRSSGATRLAAVIGDEVFDLTAHLGPRFSEVTRFLALGPEAHDMARRCLKSEAVGVPVSSVELLSPILPGDKILGVGMNYRSFIAAAQRIGMPVPTDRIWFLRPRGCIAGPYDDVWLPRGAEDFDYEAELVIVIGRSCRHVSASAAKGVVAGFTVANDLTLRQRVLKSTVLGKSFDTHTPLGPWLVTQDEIEPHELAVRTWVNGQLRQESNTAELIANCYELVSEISSLCTLNAGDVILTGTPAGSGIFQDPPSALKIGDVVRIEIDGIGAIENRVVDEPATVAS